MQKVWRNQNLTTLLQPFSFWTNLLLVVLTGVPKFSKDVDEDVSICSTAFNVRSKYAQNVFIIWDNRTEDPAETFTVVI